MFKCYIASHTSIRCGFDGVKPKPIAKVNLQAVSLPMIDPERQSARPCQSFSPICTSPEVLVSSKNFPRLCSNCQHRFPPSLQKALEQCSLHAKRGRPPTTTGGAKRKKKKWPPPAWEAAAWGDVHLPDEGGGESRGWSRSVDHPPTDQTERAQPLRDHPCAQRPPKTDTNSSAARQRERRRT